MRFELSPAASIDGEAVLSLADAKVQVRRLDDDDDDIITALRDAAIDAVQQYTSKQLAPGTRVWRGRFAEAIDLGIAPLVSVASISYLDASGASVALADGAWRIGLHGRLHAPVGGAWPETADGDGVVSVTFTVGYASGQIPKALISAVRLMLGHLYRHREAVVTGIVATDLPLGFADLCALYRLQAI